jgi:predicted TIM-barrel fold metal-dependent hydrolase
MMIIDVHTHVWPDRIAHRALGAPSAGIQRHGDGTVAGAAEAMRRGEVDRFVCLAVADTGPRLEAANAFVGGLDPARFIGFGTVHADRSPEDNLKSLRENGLRGVKVHPLFQGYPLDDARLWEILAALEGEFICLFHVGPETPGGENRLATPQMIGEIARAFPRLTIIAAHLGGYHVHADAIEHVVGLPGVYLDTSWPPSIGSVSRDQVRSTIERHGPDRVIFGSDWPMADPQAEIAAISALGFDDDTTAAILGGTFARLIGLADRPHDVGKATGARQGSTWSQRSSASTTSG